MYNPEGNYGSIGYRSKKGRHGEQIMMLRGGRRRRRRHKIGRHRLSRRKGRGFLSGAWNYAKSGLSAASRYASGAASSGATRAAPHLRRAAHAAGSAARATAGAAGSAVKSGASKLVPSTIKNIYGALGGAKGLAAIGGLTAAGYLGHKLGSQRREVSSAEEDKIVERERAAFERARAVQQPMYGFPQYPWFPTSVPPQAALGVTGSGRRGKKFVPFRTRKHLLH